MVIPEKKQQKQKKNMEIPKIVALKVNYADVARSR